MDKILITIMAIFNITIAIVYLSKGDYPRSIYWISAALLTTSTMYFK
jgi:hypothetical protein